MPPPPRRDLAEAVLGLPELADAIVARADERTAAVAAAVCRALRDAARRRLAHLHDLPPGLFGPGRRCKTATIMERLPGTRYARRKRWFVHLPAPRPGQDRAALLAKLARVRVVRDERSVMSKLHTLQQTLECRGARPAAAMTRLFLREWAFHVLAAREACDATMSRTAADSFVAGQAAAWFKRARYLPYPALYCAMLFAGKA